MQIKVHSATFKKSMNGRAKKVVRKFIDDMHDIADMEMGMMKKATNMPIQTGHLKNSYSASKDYPKKMVRFGSNASGGFEDIRYATWIETGERSGGIKRVGEKKYYNAARGMWVQPHPRTKGLWQFKLRKENVLKKIKSIKL